MPVVKIHGVGIYYVVQGQGTPLIFVHPPGLTSTSFSVQIEGLSRRFQTLAFDIRGHGKSQHSQEPVTYPLIASDIQYIMDALEMKKAFLCGYSTGGSVVLEFLLTYPDRAYGGILIGSMSEIHDVRLRIRILLGIALTRLGAIRPLAFGLSWSNSKPKRFWRTYRDAKQGDSKSVRQYYRYSFRYNCTSQLSEIHHPVLLLYGEKDKGFHSYARLLHRKLPNNELIFVRGVQHQIPTKASQQLHDEITGFIHRHLASQ